MDTRRKATYVYMNTTSLRDVRMLVSPRASRLASSRSGTRNRPPARARTRRSRFGFAPGSTCGRARERRRFDRPRSSRTGLRPYRTDPAIRKRRTKAAPKAASRRAPTRAPARPQREEREHDEVTYSGDRPRERRQREGEQLVRQPAPRPPATVERPPRSRRRRRANRTSAVAAEPLWTPTPRASPRARRPPRRARAPPSRGKSSEPSPRSPPGRTGSAR